MLFDVNIKPAVNIGHKIPNLLLTDKHGEFDNEGFNNLLKKQNNKIYYTENEEKYHFGRM